MFVKEIDSITLPALNVHAPPSDFQSGKATFTIANVLLTMNTHRHITKKLNGSKRLLVSKRVKYGRQAEKFYLLCHIFYPSNENWIKPVPRSHMISPPYHM